MRKMDGNWNHHVKENKPDKERQILHFTSEESRFKYVSVCVDIKQKKGRRNETERENEKEWCNICDKYLK